MIDSIALTNQFSILHTHSPHSSHTLTHLTHSLSPLICPLPTQLKTNTCAHTHTNTHQHTNTQTHTEKIYQQQVFSTYAYLFNTYLPTQLPTYIATCIPIYTPAYLSTYLPIYIPAYLHTYLLCLFVCQCQLELFNKAHSRDQITYDISLSLVYICMYIYIYVCVCVCLNMQMSMYACVQEILILSCVYDMCMYMIFSIYIYISNISADISHELHHVSMY